jgi:L-asparagine oxygenase
LERFAAQLRHPSVPSDLSAWADVAGQVALPDRWVRQLAQLTAGDVPAVVLDGAPVGAPALTPSAPRPVPDGDLIAHRAVLAVAAHLGEPVGFGPESYGALVQDIVPVPTVAARQVSTGSAVQLDFHTEAAFHPWSPTFLLLLCVRGDPGAATLLCAASDALAGLSPAELAVLHEPRFVFAVDESYGTPSGTIAGPSRPILVTEEGRTRWWFDADLCRGVDVEAEQVRRTVTDAVRATATSVTLQTGQILVVDNRAAAHGRSPFTPRFDGTDRWLLRSFVVSAFPPPSDRVGRTISTSF